MTLADDRPIMATAAGTSRGAVDGRRAGDGGVDPLGPGGEQHVRQPAEARSQQLEVAGGETKRDHRVAQPGDDPHPTHTLGLDGGVVHRRSLPPLDGARVGAAVGQAERHETRTAGRPPEGKGGSELLDLVHRHVFVTGQRLRELGHRFDRRVHLEGAADAVTSPLRHRRAAVWIAPADTKN